jgi:hypothetical protein
MENISRQIQASSAAFLIVLSKYWVFPVTCLLTFFEPYFKEIAANFLAPIFETQVVGIID